jgi:hypothetical protein
VFRPEDIRLGRQGAIECRFPGNLQGILHAHDSEAL